MSFRGKTSKSHMSLELMSRQKHIVAVGVNPIEKWGHRIISKLKVVA